MWVNEKPLKHARRLTVGGEIIVLFTGTADCSTSCSIPNLLVPIPFSGNLVELHLGKICLFIVQGDVSWSESGGVAVSSGCGIFQKPARKEMEMLSACLDQRKS